MIVKQFIAILFVLFLMIGATALAENDTGNETECLVSEKADYKDLRNQFYEYEDEYLYYKGKFKSSLLDSEVKYYSKYKYKLESVDDDLKDLRNDIRDVIDDVEDVSNCTDKSDLLDDLDDLKEDVGELREDVIELLAEEMAEGKVAAPAYPTTASLATLPLETDTPPAKSEVVVSTLSVGPKAPVVPTLSATATAVQPEEPAWEKTRQTAWLTAGIVVLATVVLFLLGLLFR